MRGDGGGGWGIGEGDKERKEGREEERDVGCEEKRPVKGSKAAKGGPHRLTALRD